MNNHQLKLDAITFLDHAIISARQRRGHATADIIAVALAKVRRIQTESLIDRLTRAVSERLNP